MFGRIPFIVMTCSMLMNSCTTQNLFRTEHGGHVSSLIESESLDHHIIQSDDKISLSIWNHDDMSIGSLFSIYNSNETFGKWVLVDDMGDVVLPKIGKFSIAGMTCSQASDSLKSRYSMFLLDPIIVVKVLNREVTVLGEVRSPAVYVLEKERNTVTEILGQAEGFTSYADLEKIQIIRNGTSYHIDLTRLTTEMQHSLVVQSGDIVYVPSLKRKGLDQKAPTLIPFASTLTALAIVASIAL